MRIAIGLPVAVPGAPGPGLVDWARRAEEAGFSSLGTIGRIVFDCHEELVALAAAAGATQRIGLMPTVLIGPVRESVLLAKQVATLDAISGGRLTLGIGVGWRDDDFVATGTVFAKRGKELEAQVDLLRRIWSGKPPRPGLGPVGPPPARAGGPPIVLGGMAEPALVRAGAIGDGWIAPPFPAEQVSEMFATVARAREDARREGRPRLFGAGYYTLGDAADAGRANMAAYYEAGGQDFVDQMTSALMTTPEAVQAYVKEIEGAGAEEIFLWPAVADVDQVDRLADAVLR